MKGERGRERRETEGDKGKDRDRGSGEKAEGRVKSFEKRKRD